MEYVVLNYKVEDKVLVFRPESNIELVELTRKSGFRTLFLKTGDDDNWSFEHDNHWTCYGHEKVAKQVAQFIKSNMMN